MLISLAWLDELLPGSERLTGDVVASALTSLGLEVEGVEHVGEGLDAIVVAEVKSVSPHPQADRLSVVEVHDGARTVTVVCGAPNVPDPGGRVVFAPVGVELPGGLAIAAREIRGVASAGMICSEQELDIGPDKDGIIVLPESWAVGERLADRVAGVVDTLIELSVTPNRPDALGHVGVARDLGLRIGRTLVLPSPDAPEAPRDSDLVTIDAPDRCGRYLGYAFEDAAVGPSPPWLRTRLHRLGFRPISNIVDITNLVLLEWGQPLHAFDRSHLVDGRIVVRMAKDGEPMRMLDEHELELAMDDLVICDAQAPQALAGVMGGAKSGVDETSTALVLEAAYFQPQGIRRTARRHAIGTDSSYRFERGVDYARGLDRAAWRACSLIAELAGARIVAACEALGQLPKPPVISLRRRRVEHVLGMPIPDADAERILAGLELELDRSDPERWQCVAPTHRPDLGREEDLIEELVRHHGLDRLPAVPSLTTTPPPPPPRMRGSEAEKLELLRDALRDAGLMETVSFAFADEEDLQLVQGEVPLDRAVRVANPMRVQASLCRTHLLPGLIHALALNRARHGRAVRLFELGRTYHWPEPAPEPKSSPTGEIDAQLPHEPIHAGIVMCGDVEGTSPLDARDAIGAVLNVLARLGYNAEILPLSTDGGAAFLHPGVQAKITIRDESGLHEVGRVGEIHPTVLQHWDLSGLRAFYAELDAQQLPEVRVGRYRALPRFPATSRDLSLEIPVTLPASVVVDAVREAAATIELDRSASSSADDPPRLDRGTVGDAPVEVIEDYRGAGIPSGRRALLLRLHYRALARSITDAEVEPIHEAIVVRACEALEPAAPGIRRR